ncbi:MAG: class I SAM-dependent methyltransferase [Pseudomonadota bacterium]
MASTDGNAAAHMDGIYKYQRYIYDVSRKYFLLGRDHLVSELKPPPGATVLEIGCGTGRNLILAARKYPECRFFGFDISEEMLKTARASIDKAGLSERIKVAQGDATNFDVEAMFGIRHVDRAFCSYTLSMIPPWKAVLPEALKAIGSTGEFHVVDFGQQAGWPRWFRSMLTTWLRKFTVYPRAELEEALRAAADDAGVPMMFRHLTRDYAQYAVLGRR